MNKADLEKLGLTAETIEKAGMDPDVIEKIIILHGKGIEKFKALQPELDTLKTQLADANTAIEGFKKLDPEGLAKAVDEWKAKAEQAKADGEAQVARLKFDTTLRDALKVAKAKDPADILPHLKQDMLKVDENGFVVGLKEQLEPLYENKGYLFDEEEEEPEVRPRIVAGGHNQTVLNDGVVDSARKAAGLPASRGE